jgi:hypothetical protein
MTRIDELNAQIALLEQERANAINAERDGVLAAIKHQIKVYGFVKTDFKGALRVKRKRKYTQRVNAKGGV